jgi:hypothetical protein
MRFRPAERPLSDLRAWKLIRFVERWGGACVICGLPFRDLRCVTREHIVPVSLGGGPPAWSDSLNHPNIAPPHHICNSLRGTESLLAAARRIDSKRRQMHPRSFEQWLNAGAPAGRRGHIAILPLAQARKLLGRLYRGVPDEVEQEEEATCAGY